VITMLPIVAPRAVLTVSELKKGMSSARSDDTKSLKGSILDWIVPRGQSVQPPLACNIKANRGFHHEYTGRLLCPAGIDWSDSEYNVHFCTRDRLALIHITS
jgi:hypothetical protein